MLRFRHEPQRYAIDAVALVRRRVISLAFENVPEVPAASGAKDFDAPHAHRIVFADFDVFGMRRIEERGPTTMGIESLI